MDPNAAYDEMCAAYDAGDYETAYERATGLQEWLSSGGFPPERPQVREIITYIITRY